MSVWPPNANFYASSTCVHLRLLAGPFDQGFRDGGRISVFLSCVTVNGSTRGLSHRSKEELSLTF